MGRGFGAGNGVAPADLGSPEDLAPRTVYADALQSRGDPRGEMIALELAGARPRAAELRRAHAAMWWPEPGGMAFATRDGFVYRIRTSVDRLAALQLCSHASSSSMRVRSSTRFRPR